MTIFINTIQFELNRCFYCDFLCSSSICEVSTIYKLISIRLQKDQYFQHFQHLNQFICHHSYLFNQLFSRTFMESPRKLYALQKESNFIIRKTVRPPSAIRQARIQLSPDKKWRESRKSQADSYPISRFSGPSALGLTSTCWCLYDTRLDKQLGFRQNYQRQIASLTKIMTTIIAIETMQKYEIKPNLLVRITQTASRVTGTTAYLKGGSWISLRDLLFGTMLPSGNDAAYTISQVIGYFLVAQQKCERLDILSQLEKIDLTFQNTNNYVTEFLKRMNGKADELQLIHTRYSNPHGLQNALNISTAKDILMLSMYASKNKTFSHIMSSEYKRYEYYSDQYKSNKEVRIWQNTNLLLGKGWEGVKTGITPTAGACLSSLKNGIFIVVLNCSDADRRFSQTQKLYNWYMQTQYKQVRTAFDSTQRYFQ